MKFSRLLVFLIAPLGLSFLLLRSEFQIAELTRWNWLGDVLILPGGSVQKWLVNLKLLPSPQSGGHMPDMTYILLFDLAVNWMLAAAALLIFERTYQKRRIGKEQR